MTSFRLPVELMWLRRGIVVLGAKQGTWEHDGVKWNVILGHELVELDLLGVLPPSLPVLRVVGCDGQVARRKGGHVTVM